MADRPILFSGPMVRALIEGRKTQTRRIIKLTGRLPDYIGPRGCMDDPSCWGWEMDSGDYCLVKRDKGSDGALRMEWSDWVGAYRPGDRLWVRETWTARMTHGWTIADARSRMYQEEILYKADGLDSIDGWWPSIHMPREFSRLTATVSDVRAQRLTEISEADAVAEGCPGFNSPPDHNDDCSPREEFRALCDGLNAARGFGWTANPWVCAITFTVHKCNIDQMPAPVAQREAHHA